MSDESEWRVLVVEDDTEIAGQIVRFIDGQPTQSAPGVFRVTTLTRFADALHTLETGRFDAIILDLREGDPSAGAVAEDAGRKVLESVRRMRFLPVVFYTGLPHNVLDLAGPLIQVVEKSEGVGRLLEVLREVFATRLPAVNRALLLHLERVQRDYMWDFVAEHWDRIDARSDGIELAYLLARRLAASLEGASVLELAATLGGTASVSGDPALYHPVRFYLMPPVSAVPMPGEVLRRTTDNVVEFRILLTPACYLVQGKAEFVKVLRCVALAERPEYNNYLATDPPSNSAKDKLMRLVGNKDERYFFLPAAVDLPDLVVDLQQVNTFPCGELDGWERVAALDSPFAEELLNQYSRYSGKVGTPDLDSAAVLDRIRASRTGR